MRAMSLPDPFSSIPLHRRRRREELSLDAPRQVFVVSLWCLAVVLAALLNRETIPSLSPADFIFFTLFYSLAAFFSVRIAPGLYAGLASVGVLAATFVMGYAPAMLVGVAGVGLVIPLRLLFSRRLPGLSRHRMRSIALEALAQSAMLTLCLPPVNWATNQVVNFLAAQPPFQGMAPDARIVEIIFVSLYLALMGVSITLWLLLIRSGSEPDGERDFRALLRDLKDFLRPRWQVLAVVGFLVFFLGPLIPPLYHLGPPRLRFLWLIPDVIMMVLLYSVNTTRLVLIQRVADLHALNAIGQALSASLEMKSLLEAIRREVSRLVDTSSFYLATYDEKTRTIFFPIAYEDDQPTQISSRRFGNGLTEYVIRTGEPLLIETNVFEQAARMGIEPVRVPHTGELKSYLGVPIWVGERVIGVLGLRNYRDEYAYSQDDLRLMETVAAQVGIALQNARLYDHSQRQAAALSSLNEVATLLGRGLELDKLIESVCRVVVDVMGSEKAAVFLLDEESSTLRLAGSVGLSERYRELSTAIDLDSARARAVRAAETVVVEDTHTVPHLKEILDVVQAEGYRAVLEVPLRLSDKVIGTLSAYYPHPRRFEAGEIELMQTLGGQVAIAVE
ncbi:MAG TPA: GAF domain-containing protein, partial [Chloroflexi bacterium]|nr:GAF domain-containing protein [Chloroflexota bacterium]